MDEEQLLREQYEEDGSFESTDFTDSSSSEGGCGRYIYVFLGIALIFVLASVWRYYALIGSFNASLGELSIYNDASVDLDLQAIETAAQPLRQNFGVDIEIHIVDSTANPETNSPLANLNFRSATDSIPADKLAIIIGVDEQYSEITWGANLDRLDGDRIRGEALNPRLNERDYTGAIIRTFDASLERLRDSNLAVDTLMQGYFEYLDEALVVGFILFMIGFALYSYSQNGWQNGDSGTTYNSGRGSGSFRSSSSSGGSSSRSSSSGRSGGSSKGSWKD